MSVYVIGSLTIKDAVRFEDYKRTVVRPKYSCGTAIVLEQTAKPLST
jgi:hypothetical protein